ncbi:hypothetical protein CDD83_3084 [Cordyceps sp. RAO-2017]|nr:hypothetical protein CDD83_3084 [Cordyceps sp. RAO-2017]
MTHSSTADARPWPLLLLLLSLTVAVANVVASSPAAVQAREPLRQRALTGRFLHITDFHPDALYKVHSSTKRRKACHRGHGMAGSYGAERTDCDSPMSLVNATFDWIARNIRDDVDFVVWTGDSARHDSDKKNKRNPAEIIESNRAVADMFLDTFSAPGSGRLAVPVIPTFGNNDILYAHNVMKPGPNRSFRVFADIWRRFIPDDQRDAFHYGGWFYVDVIPGRLAVFSLNTMFFFERNTAVDGCARPSEPGHRHMEWLRLELQRLRDRGMKAILMGHVPPARTGSKQNWHETCWQRYTLWLRQYRDVVTASLFGHMNIDHFMLQDTRDLDLGGDDADEFDDEFDDDDDDEDEDDEYDEYDDDEKEDADGDAQEEDDQDVDQDATEIANGWKNRRIRPRSKGDYLQELRDEWSDLPDSIAGALADGDDEDRPALSGQRKGRKKKNKYRNIGGKYAERYQVSLVSPSVVPNYLPTLRVFEYNTTGLEQAAVWEDPFDGQAGLPPSSPAQAPDGGDDEGEGVHVELRRQVGAEEEEGSEGEERLVVPEGPAKESLPGPAYRLQPLTLTGYVQYFANLTYINNDVEGAGWRDGGAGGKRPKHSRPRPRAFAYEVEYSTFDDRLYGLRDLTVRRYVHLAYRMGREEAARGAARPEPMGKKKKKDDDEEEEERNRTWLHFLSHAFVGTMSREDLEEV